MIFILDNIIGTYCPLLYWTTTNERTNGRPLLPLNSFNGVSRRDSPSSRPKKKRKEKEKKEEKIFKVQNRAKGVCR